MTCAVAIGLTIAVVVAVVLAVLRRRHQNPIIGTDVPWPEETISVWRRRR